MNLTVPSAADGKSYITYMFKDGEEIVYVGRASGPGLPEQVLNRRIGAGHEHWRPGLTKEVIDVQATKAASQGAEEFFKQGVQQEGAVLRNIDPPLSLRPSLRGKSISKLEAFFKELTGG